MKTICIINGHVKEESTGRKLAKVYRERVSKGDVQVEYIDLPKLHFNPVLTNGYETQLEQEIIEVQEMIKKSDLLVFMYPIYWYGVPSLVKGFLDKLFWKDVAFNFKDKKYLFDGLFKGKKTRVIYTLGGDKMMLKLLSGDAATKAIKGMFRVSGMFSNQFTAVENLDNPKRKPYELYKNGVEKVAAKDLKRIGVI